MLPLIAGAKVGVFFEYAIFLCGKLLKNGNEMFLSVFIGWNIGKKRTFAYYTIKDRNRIWQETNVCSRTGKTP